MKRQIVIGGLVVALAALAGGAAWMLRPQSPIPPQILADAGIGVWYPRSDVTGYTVDAQSVKYHKSGNDQLVSFVARSKNGELTFTEQPVPESMVDVPEVYTKLTEKMRAYGTVEGIPAVVTLTRPEELKGGQTAVFKSQGTLVFIRPSAQLSSEDWRRVVNGLELAKR